MEKKSQMQKNTILPTKKLMVVPVAKKMPKKRRVDTKGINFNGKSFAGFWRSADETPGGAWNQFSLNHVFFRFRELIGFASEGLSGVLG